MGRTAKATKQTQVVEPVENQGVMQETEQTNEQTSNVESTEIQTTEQIFEEQTLTVDPVENQEVMQETAGTIPEEEEQTPLVELTENQEIEQTAEQTPPVDTTENQETENTVAKIFGVPDSILGEENLNKDAYNNFVNSFKTPPDEPTENQETETALTDIDIISELNEAVKLQRTKRPEFVAGLIKEILEKDFVKSKDDTKYTNAIYEIKEYIGNIRKNCPYKPSKCIVYIEWTLKKLNG